MSSTAALTSSSASGGAPYRAERVTFRQFLEEEMTTAQRAADEHERHGRAELAEWWRRRSADLRAYCDQRLEQVGPAPGSG